MKDVKLYFVQAKNLLENPYTLCIYTDSGVKFYKENENEPTKPNPLTLEGKLIYNKSNILDEKTCVCKWF